jgi:hypothetical protein
LPITASAANDRSPMRTLPWGGSFCIIDIDELPHMHERLSRLRDDVLAASGLCSYYESGSLFRTALERDQAFLKNGFVDCFDLQAIYQYTTLGYQFSKAVIIF